MVELLAGMMVLFSNILFWAGVVGSLCVWYILVIAFARSFFHAAPTDPMRAAKNGLWVSLFVTTVGVSILTWFIWQSLPLTILIGGITFMIPSITILILLSLEQA